MNQPHLLHNRHNYREIYFRPFFWTKNNDFYINNTYFRKDLLFDIGKKRDELNFDNNNNKVHYSMNEQTKKRFMGELDFFNKIKMFENQSL